MLNTDPSGAPRSRGTASFLCGTAAILLLSTGCAVTRGISYEKETITLEPVLVETVPAEMAVDLTGLQFQVNLWDEEIYSTEKTERVTEYSHPHKYRVGLAEIVLLPFRPLAFLFDGAKVASDSEVAFNWGPVGWFGILLPFTDMRVTRGDAPGEVVGTKNKHVEATRSTKRIQRTGNDDVTVSLGETQLAIQSNVSIALDQLVEAFGVPTGEAQLIFEIDGLRKAMTFTRDFEGKVILKQG
ncbi:MAG: hypothetical protein ACI82F_002720 [Planctomycetota bacterium]|jgi:hypothetical protein